MAVRTAPDAAATASVISPIPSAVPKTWGSVRRNPKVAPDAHNRTLFGPGVTELANENPMSPR